MEYANHKEINYQIVTDEEALSDVPFDKKSWKIVMNLLINSFKYTCKGDAKHQGRSKSVKSKYNYSYSVEKSFWKTKLFQLL